MVAALRLENIAPFRLRPSPQEARGPIPTSNWLIPVRTLMHCSTYTHHVSILNYVCPEPVLVNRRVSQDDVILRTKRPAVSSNRMVGVKHSIQLATLRGQGRVLVGSCPGTHILPAGYDGSGGSETAAKRLRCSRETVMAELASLKTAGVSSFFNFQQRMEEKHCRPYYPNCLRKLFDEGCARK